MQFIDELHQQPIPLRTEGRRTHPDRVVVGAFVLVGLPELLREFSEFRLLIYGVVLVAMLGVVALVVAGILPYQRMLRDAGTWDTSLLEDACSGRLELVDGLRQRIAGRRWSLGAARRAEDREQDENAMHGESVSFSGRASSS